MIELHITMTSKSFAPSAKWQQFDHQRKVFADKNAAFVWLREQYGKAKRSAMYRDTKDGKTERVGYVIGFRSGDWSHAPLEKWLQQDWIEFRECKAVAP